MARDQKKCENPENLLKKSIVFHDLRTKNTQKNLGASRPFFSPGIFSPGIEETFFPHKQGRGVAEQFIIYLHPHSRNGPGWYISPGAPRIRSSGSAFMMYGHLPKFFF